MSTAAELTVVPADYQRKRYLGSSDIAGVMGISPWATPVSIWQKKTDNEPPRNDSPFKKRLFNRGKVWESVVSEMLVAELEANGHKVEVLNANRRYVDPLVDYLAAEIDYEIRLDDIPDIVNVELKTVSPFAAKHWGESGTDEVPLWYAAQGMYGLMVTNRKCCILAPLFGADEVRIYPIVRDDETIAGMRDQAVKFWTNHVLPRVPPEPMDLADVNRLFRKGRPETVAMAEPAVIEAVLKYRALDAEVTAREAERDLVEYQIKKFMGDATILQIPGREGNAVTWRLQSTSRLDQQAFKDAYPKLHKQFMVSSESRVFKVNKQ